MSNLSRTLERNRIKLELEKQKEELRKKKRPIIIQTIQEIWRARQIERYGKRNWLDMFNNCNMKRNQRKYIDEI